MRNRDLLTLIVLATLWGGSFLFIRIAAPVLGPFPLALGRVVLGGAVLWAILQARGMRTDVRPHLRKLLVLGLFNAALPYALIAAAEVHITASLAAMLNATIPMMTAVMGIAILGEPMTPRRAGGLLLGVAGVALIVGWTPFESTWTTAASIAATLVACVSYSGATIYARKAFHGVPAPTLAFGQQVGAAAWLLLPALWTLPQAHVTAAALGALAALAVLSTAVAYLLYFRLVKNVGPTGTATVAYLFPVFGSAWGALFLHERVSLGMIAGLVVVGASVLLVVRAPARRAGALATQR